MNYNEFINAVEEKLSVMSEKYKTKWIYNKARTAKEHERIKFLNSLNYKQDYRPFIYEKDKIEEWCRKVEVGEIYFECNGYEEYGENYWDGDYVYDYYDVFGIINDLNKAFKVAEDLLFQKKHKESSILNNRLLNMSFYTLDRDTEEWNELDLEEAIDEIPITFDYNQVILNVMYAIYQDCKGKNRAENLYRYLTRDKCKNIKIEDIFRIGPEELKYIDSFMEEWISFLINVDGDRAGELLLEGCLYQGGISRLCETAKAEHLQHPILFKYTCEHLLDENKDSECEEIGLEAMRVLAENLIVRGEIADLTAKAATNLKHFDVVNKCYEIAFYSKSILNNYFRLFELPDYKNIAKKATTYVEILPEDYNQNFSCKNKQMIINSLSKSHKDIIKFFSGEFDYIYEMCKKDNTTLGWSTGFKGVVVPLFILLLNKNGKVTKAGDELINGIIHRIGFMGGDVNSFFDMFLNWKDKQILSAEQDENYMSWTKEEVDKRTDAVVGEGHRKSYYKAAILIVTLGEALESNGMIDGRRALIEHYKKIHSRKRAFKAEFELLDE